MEHTKGEIGRDLYSDLLEDCGDNGDTLVRTQNAALREQIKLQQSEIHSLKLQLQHSGEATLRLREENITLEKNISCLYKTAVLVRTLRERARKVCAIFQAAPASVLIPSFSTKQPPPPIPQRAGNSAEGQRDKPLTDARGRRAFGKERLT